MATNGFKITSINFRTDDYEIEAGQYVYSLDIKPTSISFSFGFSYKGSSTINTVTVDGLTANVRQRVEKVFNLTNAVDKFYPCRQIDAEIFQPVINKGTKAIDPSVNPDDASAGIKIEVDRLTLQVAGKIDQEDVSAMIEVKMDSIKLAVKDDLNETGIDIANKKIMVKADTFEVKDNNNNLHSVFEIKDGVPVLRTNFIDVDTLIAKKMQTPFLETQASNTSQFQADLLAGRNIIYGGGGQIKYNWTDLMLPTGYNGLGVNIHSQGGTPNRLRLKSASGIIYEDNRVVSDIKLLPFVNERISLLSSMGNGVSEWTVASRTSVIPKQESGGIVYYPSILKPGDVVFRARVSSGGSILNVKNRWYHGYSYSHSNNKRWFFGDLYYFSTSGNPNYVDIRDKVTVIFTGAGTVNKNIEPIYQFNNGYVWANGIGSEEYIITLIATDYINQSPYAEP